MAVKERKTDISVECPSCGKTNKIRQDAWDRSVSVSKGDPDTKQPVITCDKCKQEIDAPSWHRSRERAYFRQVGVTTPRMEQ